LGISDASELAFIIGFPAVIPSLNPTNLLGFKSFLGGCRGVFQHGIVKTGQADIQSRKLVIVTDERFNLM
jgi:hypothetical protein